MLKENYLEVSSIKRLSSCTNHQNIFLKIIIVLIICKKSKLQTVISIYIISQSEWIICGQYCWLESVVCDGYHLLGELSILNDAIRTCNF